MINNRIVNTFICVILSLTQTVCQEHLGLNKSKLGESLSEFRSEVSLRVEKKEYHFSSTKNFEIAYSEEIISELCNRIDDIFLPFDKKLLYKIRFVKCHFATENYDIWYIVLINKNKEHYFYSYADNTRIKSIPLIGKIKDEDFIWEIAELLFNNCEEKNDDYMIFAEVENDVFTSFKATQTFSTADNTYFNMILSLIKLKGCD